MRVLLTLLLSGAMATLPSLAAAQDPTASETALAREAYQSGMAAVREDRWEDAYQSFARAYALVGRPLILLNLATAQVQTGRLVEGAESYRRFVREATEGAVLDHRDEASARLAELEPRIPRAVLRLADLEEGDEVTLDGRPLSRAALAAPLPLDPGPHALEVRRSGEPVASTTFRLEEGQQREVSLDAPPGIAPTSAPPATTTASASIAPEEVAAELVATEEPEPLAAAARSDRDGAATSPWLWTSVALVVVGGAALAIALTRNRGTEDPFLGNVDSGTWSLP